MRALMCPTHGVSQANPTGFCKKCGARLVATDIEPEAYQRGKLGFLTNVWQSQSMITWVGIAVVVLILFGLFVWPRMRRPPDGPPQIDPTHHPALVAPTLPGSLAGASTATIAAPTSAPPSATAPPRSQAPTATQPARATKIEPAHVVSGTLPITLRVDGTNLNQVGQATLNLPSGATATTAFRPGTADQFTLIVSALPRIDDRELTFTLQLDGRAQAGVQFVAQDYIESKVVKGVKAEYIYTNRIYPQEIYTRMRAAPNVASASIGKLYNGDTVDVLRDNAAGWYQLRIFKSRDPAQHNATGWIEHWLIDNTGVPPEPSPTPLPAARFSARVDVNFEGSGNSGQFRSCVAGRVQTGDERTRYQGALINVNNGPKNSFNTRTARNGEYRVCGLGASHWDVVLLQVPGMTLAEKPRGVVYLNGDGREAIVHFIRQR